MPICLYAYGQNECLSSECSFSCSLCPDWWQGFAGTLQVPCTVSGVCRNWPSESLTPHFPGRVIKKLSGCSNMPHKVGKPNEVTTKCFFFRTEGRAWGPRFKAHYVSVHNLARCDHFSLYFQMETASVISSISWETTSELLSLNFNSSIRTERPFEIC